MPAAAGVCQLARPPESDTSIFHNPGFPPAILMVPLTLSAPLIVADPLTKNLSLVGTDPIEIFPLFQ